MDEVRLPLEILLHIISCLESRSDVLRCALVCQEWLTASRTVTFANLVAIIGPKDVVMRAPTLLAILSYPQSTIRPFLTHISITLHILTVNYDNVFVALVELAIPVETLVITWRGAELPQSPRPLLLSFLESICPTLRTVEFRAHTKIGAISLLHAVSSAPLLTNIVLMADEPPSLVAIPPVPPALRTLKTNYMNLPFIMTWALHADDVTIIALNLEDLEAFRNFFQRKESAYSVSDGSVHLKVDSAQPNLLPVSDILIQRASPALLRNLRWPLDWVHSVPNNFSLGEYVNLRCLSLYLIIWKACDVLSILAPLLLSLKTLPMSQTPGFTLSLDLDLHIQPAEMSRLAMQMDEMLVEYVREMTEAKSVQITVTNRVRQLKSQDFRRCTSLAEIMGHFAFKCSH